MGWLFDGLDMHLYTLVATPFVMQLLHAQSSSDLDVRKYSGIIQAAFLVGWALGGGFFGRVGDLMGRTRTLNLTILTYALFTGLSFFSQTWWQLCIFRFLAALGIGGEWAVGASMLSETWPKRWRPWMAAVLQTGVNIGVLLATGVVSGVAWIGQSAGAEHTERFVFLAGILPALLTLWIRKQVPETAEWRKARMESVGRQPGVADLFRGSVRSITLRTLLTCAVTLTAHWAFLFWYLFHLRDLPEVRSWGAAEKSFLASKAMFVVMGFSIFGNFLAAFMARFIGYPRAIAILCAAYFGIMFTAYSVPRPLDQLWFFLAAIGSCQGIFALFTMYLPPLFPTLLRTTGAGFCYNIGRIAAAAGTVVFGVLPLMTGKTAISDYRSALYYASFLFIPACLIALTMPELKDEPGKPA
ncbi:MAG: MFS transporter [Verrucomicrobia bacterium]|nr:MFS transporter [Verrucomicrobiota bacterium]